MSSDDEEDEEEQDSEQDDSEEEGELKENKKGMSRYITRGYFFGGYTNETT